MGRNAVLDEIQPEIFLLICNYETTEHFQELS